MNQVNLFIFFRIWLIFRYKKFNGKSLNLFVLHERGKKGGNRHSYTNLF